MMMGGGFLVMFFVLLILIGVPLLLVALITGGGLTTLFRSRPHKNPPSTSPPVQSTSFRGETVEPNYVRKCPTCGRGVKADWNVCPSCGATLN